MKQSQAERLTNVLKQDKSISPLKLSPALKSDIRDLLREYGELLGDVTLEIQDCEDGYNVIILAKISRFKAYGNIV